MADFLEPVDPADVCGDPHPDFYGEFCGYADGHLGDCGDWFTTDA